MSVLEGIAGVVSTGGTGAIFGAIGGIASKWLQYKTTKENNEFELKMRDFDVKEAALERKHDLDIIDKKIDKAEVEGEIAYREKDLEALKASISAAGQQNSGIGWIEGVKGLMRPFVILVGLVFLFSVTFVLGYDFDDMTAAQRYELFDYCVRQGIFLSMGGVGWLFAMRPARLDKPVK